MFRYVICFLFLQWSELSDMKLLTRRRIYVNLLLSFIISLLLILPMILELMGYDPFGGIRYTGRQSLELSNILVVIKQAVFFFTMIFMLLTVFTVETRKFSWTKKIIAGFLITIVFYILFPIAGQLPPPQARMNPVPFNPDFNGMPGIGSPERPGIINIRLDIRFIMQFAFLLATTGLIGKVFELVVQKQQIEVENEKLRADNLQSQYDVLLKQVNPHFFFNTMNSLASLVREGRKESALKYIEELSDTFRYVMQSSDRELVTLKEELDSLSAYCYLLQIRYEGKLFFDINVNESFMQKQMPVLTLQPLIENVVKHNAITQKEPLNVIIKGNGDSSLIVSNQKRPRKDEADHSGIGLKNLATRYKLLTGNKIIIEDNGNEFSVILPLINAEQI
jgi:two-component system, LytTR family, sensor kinase